MQDTPDRRTVAPVVAAALALAYPAAVAAGAEALAGVTALAAVAACALVLARRPSARLRIALGAIAGWLVVALGGAFLLRAHPVRGLAWVLAVLYALPLPLIPWLYAATFDVPERTGQRGNGTGQRNNGDAQAQDPTRTALGRPRQSEASSPLCPFPFDLSLPLAKLEGSRGSGSAADEGSA